MELIRIFGISLISIVLTIIAGGSAKPPTLMTPVKPNMEFIQGIKTNLYNGYSECKEELGLPGDSFGEFKKEIIADKVDGQTVGCALTCLAKKANYVKENRIDENKLKDDLNSAFNFENQLLTDLKVTVNKCSSKSNTQFSDDSCKLIKGLFGCVMNEFRNGTVGQLIVSLSSIDRKTLYSKFTEV